MASLLQFVDLTDTYGAALIGAMVSFVLYGITTLQTYLYFTYYPKDNWTFKGLVTALWITDTLQVAFVGRFLYTYLIINFANPLILIQGHWTIIISLLCNLIVATMVQIFFATRVHYFGKKIWLTGLIAFFIVAHVAFGLETVVQMFRIKFFTQIQKIKYTAALPFAIAAVIPDVLIAGSLCYFLNNGRQGFRGTELLINRLMIYAINRCLLTSAAAITEMVVYSVLPDTFIFLAVDFCIGKLYVNSLLATLNTRKSLRGKGHGSEGSTLPSSGYSGSGANGGVHVQLSNFRATPPKISNVSSTDHSMSFGHTLPGSESDIMPMYKSDKGKEPLQRYDA